jgi:hypothetical protein
MSDIFAVADIMREVLNHLEHYILMRACCCKKWLAAAQDILSAVTHTSILNFGYMAACYNLVSIDIDSNDVLDNGRIRLGEYTDKPYHIISEYIFPNIRTIVCGTYNIFRICRLQKIFTNAKSIVLNCDGCHASLAICSTYIHSFGVETIKIINAWVTIHDILYICIECTIPITLDRCKILSPIILKDTPSVTLLNCIYYV